MKHLLLLIAIPFWVCASAQILPNSFGFSTFSGENGVTSADAFSLWNNPAMLSEDSICIGISVEQVFANAELFHFNLSGQFPTDFANIGVGVHRFGDELMNETTLSLGAGKELGEQIQVGASILYINSFAEFAESASTIYPQLGMAYSFNDRLNFGFTARNPLSQDLKEPWDQNLEAVYALGVGYMASEDFSTSLQADVNEEHGLAAGVGIDYRVFDLLSVQLGGKSNPGYVTGGITLRYNQIKGGIGASQQSPLGLSPNAVFQTMF